ncbi:hypothetical protein M0R72_08025 [Candidatus Pacearchaeota archaeon]|jgi:hypothetical protein|nr:hypothetical protein [Candidatus Pacearchaeota archaeon]
MLCVHHGKFEEVGRQIARRKLTLDYYRPTVSVPVSIGDKIEWRQEPAFDHYLFVSTRIPKTTIDLSLPTLIDYIDRLPLSPVIFGNWIANITDEKLAEIQKGIEGMNATSKLRANAGDFAAAYIDKTVMITSGAFGGTFGQVLGAAGAGMIAIEIALFDQATRCKVRMADVELV